MKLDNKLILVTGASRGIGAASAKALAREGATMLLLARTQADLDARVAEIEKEGGKAFAYAVDVSSHEEVAIIATRIKQEHGIPDVIINNAGIGRWLFAEETPPEEAVGMIHLPYLAAFFITREFLPGMRARNSGQIVQINSPASIVPWAGATAYASTRWALRGFNEALRADLYGTGIWVSHCLFGVTESDYWSSNEGARERLPGIGKIFRVLTVEEVGKKIVRVVKRRKRRMVAPFLLWLVVKFNGVAPGLVRWLTLRSGYRKS